MSKVLIAMAFLGCAVMCYSHPVIKQESQNNNEETIENPTLVRKERHKRTANYPPDKSEHAPVDQSVHQSVEHLAKDSGFLKNLEFVFGSQTERKQNIAPANFVFDASLDNFTNENNTGLEDRLRSFAELQAYLIKSTESPNNGLHNDSKDDQDDQKRKTFGHPSNSVEHATAPPELGSETTKQRAVNFEDNPMLQVFGTPPVQTKQTTVTPQQTVTQKKQADENTADTDKSSASASANTSKENNGNGNNGSSTKITFIYLYFISVIFVLVCS